MSWSGGKDMTYGDGQFLREMGIDPCLLDDPFPRPLPPRLPPGPVIPSLTEKDACWLLNLGVRWEPEPEPDFVPPRSVREYLARYPTGIREAVEAVASELGIALPDGALDDLAQDVVQMFLDFNGLGLEDVVQMFSFYSTLHPERYGRAHFHDYIRMRVAACVPVVLRNDPTGTDALGESLGS